MAIEEYVPDIKPTIKTNINGFNVSPPNRYIAIKVTSSVILVLKDLPNV